MDRKEQIKQAKRLIATGIIKDLVEVLEKQFPELAESEDEKIRKEIITLLQEIAEDDDYCGRNHCDEYIAYLEKQKEQKPAQLVLHDTFGYEEGRQTGQNEGVKLVLNNPEKYGLQKEQKPAEWSERENKMLESAISHIRDSECFDHFHDITKEDIIAWLKSLRPQPHWKPSEEQVKVLKAAIVYVESSESNFKLSGSVLESLYNDLKKL